jgi:anaerobic ribonucleoside-triphosphate reductase activating protein
MGREEKHLRVAAIVDHTQALGPGNRFAIWLQGCPFACPGCIEPDFLPFDGGQEISIEGVLDRSVKGRTSRVSP